MAAGIEQFAGDWYVDVDVEPDNELAEALFGPVIIERKLGAASVAGVTNSGVSIELTEVSPRGAVFGRIHREQPPLDGILHLINDGGNLFGVVTSDAEDGVGLINAADIRFTRPPEAPDTD